MGIVAFVLLVVVVQLDMLNEIYLEYFKVTFLTWILKPVSCHESELKSNVQLVTPLTLSRHSVTDPYYTAKLTQNSKGLK